MVKRIKDTEEEVLAPELKPEFIEKMKKKDNEPTIYVGLMKDFEKRYG